MNNLNQKYPNQSLQNRISSSDSRAYQCGNNHRYYSNNGVCPMCLSVGTPVDSSSEGTFKKAFDAPDLNKGW